MSEIFSKPKTDDKTDEADEKADEEAHDRTDDEQPDTTDMPNLENEESAEQRNQKGQGLKILIKHQMLCRLSISLAQLKAENNSEKLKNEIRQPL